MSCKPAIEIVPGMVFGRLTTIEIAPKGKRGVERWHVKCACGTEKNIIGRNLRSGKAKSCGCRRAETATKIGKANKGRPFPDRPVKVDSLIGRVFGRLAVIEVAGRTPARAVLWRCSCPCGSTKVVVRDTILGNGS
jgi:hypothetical protein